MLTAGEAGPVTLTRAAVDAPDRVFVEEVDGARLTNEDMHVLVRGWVAILRDAGVGEGTRVLTMLPNSATAVAVWFACGWLGAWEVPVNSEYQGELLAHVVRTSGARHLVAPAASTAPFLELDVAEASVLQDVLVPCGDDPAAADAAAGAWQERHENVRVSLVSDDEATDPVRVATVSLPSDEFEKPRPRDVACVLFTSGTTGPSKGVICTWSQLYNAATGLIPIADYGEHSGLYSPFPMYHNGGRIPVLAMLMAGARVVLRNGFSVSRFLTEVDAHRCDSALVFQSDFLHKLPEQEVRRSPLRRVFGGVKDHAGLLDLGIETSTHFGMTELSSPVYTGGWLPRDAPKGTIGKLRPGYEVRLVDDDDEPVPTGEVGELAVRTSVPWTIMQGYLEMPEATVRAWRNLWFHTGDLVRCDDEGWFYFVDRKKDAVRRGGENISSLEVEAIIGRHPGIAAVAVVAAKEASYWGDDEVFAIVVPAEGTELTEQDVHEHCRQVLPRFMVPRFIELRDELPKTRTGKIQKGRLRSEGVPAGVWDARQAR